MNAEDTPLAHVLAALAAPAHDAELTGRDLALAAFREAAADPSPVIGRQEVNRSTLAKLLTLKTGVAVLCVTALGGVAFAAGGNPLADDKGKDDKGHHAPAHHPKSAPTGPAPTGTPTAAPATPPGHVVALCVRILKAVDDENPADGKPGKPAKPGQSGKPDKPGKGPKELKHKAKFKPKDIKAWEALVQAAGGEDEAKILAYCASLVPGHGPKPDKPGKPSGHPTGKPAQSGRPGTENKPGGKPGKQTGPSAGAPADGSGGGQG
ncbi:hypothetical protein EDD29_6477 [Actinocorallia herbida]|uniref:Uncharacterized protein n=1 Tax=Actinocorallia herbida TaxID=58109 RepID=A0A3N1D5G7_9ACTN|nr:hypothetical protein [Actinocorallia herbida]ROO88795.1 hypothetical protein EDD29_6477 [Actinocorallia herbida]